MKTIFERWCFSSILVLSIAAPFGGRAVAQTAEFKTGAVGSVLRVIPSSSCSPLATWYNPDLFVDGNNVLRLVAQSGRATAAGCSVSLWDNHYSATRSTPSAAWSTPTASTCPHFRGGYTRCSTPPFEYSPANPGPVGDSDVLKIGSTYYMAFNGGNADFIVGRAYWATSSDGISWSVYNVAPPAGELWTPLVAPRYHECRNGAPFPDGPPDPIPGGITETYLAFEPSDTSMGPNGTFYLYLGHWGLQPFGPTAIDSWAIRFAYQPTSPFGIGTQRQIWHRTTATNGTWKPFNSGSMVWDFDSLPDPSGEPVLAAGLGENPSGRFFPGGGGALRRDPLTNDWLHVFTFAGVTQSQRATSLAANLWTAAVPVDMTTVTNLVPPIVPPLGKNDPPVDHPYEPGLYYGTGGNRTGWWIYTPINHLGCRQIYLGLGIVPAELCKTAAPAINTVAPSSGNTSGGTSVSISGTALDCASAVSFGGTPATIVSRAPGLVQVTTPSHAAGTVNVVLITPAGSVTKTSAYTYTAPPAYAGYHDGIDCFGTFGWAWDSNRPTTPIAVDIYDGAALLGSVLADQFRQDLLNAGIGDGRHGFGFSLPASVRDGQLHTITVKFGGTSTPLSNTPKTIQCAGLPSVSIVATDAEASESPSNLGQFTLTRTGSTASALPVTLSRSGTATNGTDYVSISTTQSFTEGQGSMLLAVTPVDDTTVEAPETVILGVAAGTGYVVGSPASATVRITSNDFVPCAPSATKLCLVNGRFEVTLSAFANGTTYTGHAVAFPPIGAFWLFSPQILEVGVKLLDEGNGRYSVTYGAGTDLATTLTVKDLASNLTEVYTRPAGNLCGGADNQAFVKRGSSLSHVARLDAEPASAESTVPKSTCQANPTTTCLLGGRFQVRVKKGTPSTYQQAASATDQTGVYWFSTASSPDVFVKVVDGSPSNYWVYFGSMTSQAYTVEVTDSTTGDLKSYSRSVAQAYCGLADTGAFPMP